LLVAGDWSLAEEKDTALDVSIILIKGKMGTAVGFTLS